MSAAMSNPASAMLVSVPQVSAQKGDGDALLSPIWRQSLERAQHTAIETSTSSLSYAQLHKRVAGAAAALSALGVRANDVLAIAAEREIETFIWILAALRSGAAYLPLDLSYPPARLTAMIEDARPRLLLGSASALRQMPVAEVRTVDIATLSAEGGGDPVAGHGAYVLFTSGSTGRPKGVAMGRAPLVGLISWQRQHARLGVAARTLQFAPLSFDVSFQELFGALWTGGTLILPSEAERRDPFALLERLAQARVERLYLPYVALQALAEAYAAGGTLPNALRDLVTAGEQLLVTPAIRALCTALPGCWLHNHYGPTETHVVTAHELCGDPALWPDVPPIGRALPHVCLHVVDASGVALADGNEGELLIGGECLADGYINRPELSAERFVDFGSERVYRVGDLVRRDGDVLQYLGRADQQIKIDGYRIEPGEIEMALCRHSAVRDAAVVAVDGAQGKRLAAHIVPRATLLPDGEDALRTTLREHLSLSLAAYQLPAEIVFRAALPTTPSGKIDRRALIDSASAAPLVLPPADAPLDRQVSALWKTLLGLSELDPDANVFELGARSLTVVQVLTELRRRGHATISAAQIYESPSVNRLVALLAAPAAALSSVGVAARGAQQRAALARFARPPAGAPKV
jgi:amino acid adenylation domain-containing protein